MNKKSKQGSDVHKFDDEERKYYCFCKTVAVSHSFVKWSSMNTNATQGSNVHYVDNEVKC